MQEKYQKAMGIVAEYIRSTEEEASIPNLDISKRQQPGRLRADRLMQYDREFRTARKRNRISEEQWQQLFRLETEYRNLAVRMQLDDPWREH